MLPSTVTDAVKTPLVSGMKLTVAALVESRADRAVDELVGALRPHEYVEPVGVTLKDMRSPVTQPPTELSADVSPETIVTELDTPTIPAN